jgi:ABC-2 type transport system permease protein
VTAFILKILDGFRRLFELLKVDYPKFKELLWVKLTIDNRQEKSVVQRRSNKDVSNSMIWVMFTYAFIGLFAGLLLVQIPSPFTALILVQSMIMVMTAVALISDFSSVLLDTTDNAILQFRPVDGRTLAVARIVHVTLYMLMITLSLSLGTLVVGTVKYGPVFTLTFPVSLVFSVLFIVFLSNIFYLLLIKISGEERFRDIILYFQIFMAAVALGSYQLLPRFIGAALLKDFSIEIRWWTYLVPPAWVAAPVDAAVRGVMSRQALALTLMGIGLPVLFVILVVRYLAPRFNEALLELEKTGSGREKKRLSRSLLLFFSRIATSRPVERAAFQLVWLISGRDRKFKLKTYPTFGYMLIIAAVMSLRGKGGLAQMLQNLPNTKLYLVFLYLGCMLIPMTLFQMRLSDQFQAAWIYRSLPIARPGDLFRGGVKAMVVKFGVSIFFLLSIPTLFIWGPPVIDDVGLAFVNMIFTSYVLSLIVKNELPFAKPYGVGREAQKGIAGFILLILPGFLGIVHFGLTSVPYGVPAAVPVMAVLIWPVSKIIDSTRWDMIAPF